MSYDSHSKHILLIATIHILGYILNLLEPATSVMGIFQSDEVEYRDSLMSFSLFVSSLYILMIVLAVVMVLGVIKQRHVLIAPWLIMSGLILVTTITAFILDFFMESIFLNELHYSTNSLGMQILVLYPTYTFYMKLSPKSLRENLFEEAVDTKLKRNDNAKV